MKISFSTLALAAALALAGNAHAQQQPGAQPGPGAKQQQAQGQQEQRKGVVTAAGKVTDVRQVKTKAGDTHHVVRLETMDGKMVVANLGAGKVRKIEKGDMLFVSGRAARMDGKPVIFARYVGELEQVGQIGKAQQAAAKGGKAAAGATQQPGAAGATGQPGGGAMGQPGAPGTTGK